MLCSLRLIDFNKKVQKQAAIKVVTKTVTKISDQKLLMKVAVKRRH